MSNYKQLGQGQRYVIDRLLGNGKKPEEIADVLGYNKSTISRELKAQYSQTGQGRKQHDPERLK
ncbi:MAG: helix-turn-helix domain-containing protein [Cyclobacteriaceae bacterium]|nr:helix-turn-helix domain-containing protein [Cyclobacteriaceae bacterium]